MMMMMIPLFNSYSGVISYIHPFFPSIFVTLHDFTIQVQTQQKTKKVQTFQTLAKF